MGRTLRDHERAEALERQNRADRRLREVEDEDTIYDEPLESDPFPEGPAQGVTIASVPPEGTGDDLKCERVQDRGPGRRDDEG
jgi:hypothetical protein